MAPEDDEVMIDPWSSNQSTDYARIRDQFGLQSLSLARIRDPSMLHRRGIIFAHRDLDVILDTLDAGKPCGVLTGLMPSGKMHLGHSLVIEQLRWFQSQGADVTIAVADLEALATRGISLEEGRRVAIDEYICNYVALGLDPEKTSVYFQSRRPIVQRLGFQLGKKTNLSALESIYGFNGSSNLAHVQAPLIQAGDILHPMLDAYGGLRPIVVPVGVDQDPHIRLTRDLAQATNWFNVRERRGGGLVVGFSVQEENRKALGVGQDGRVDMERRREVFGALADALQKDGWADIRTNPKHGVLEIPAATSADRGSIRLLLLREERAMGGLGLMPPSSTYHRFAVGLTGDKMSSSKPETTIFLDDDNDTVKKRINNAFSGGRASLTEHRKHGGDPEIDVAFQYLNTFFEPNDQIIAETAASYRKGTLLTGELKKQCIDAAVSWLGNIRARRESLSDEVERLLAHDGS